MRIRTCIRTSSALSAFPIAMILVVLYYSENTYRQIEFFSIYPDASVLVQRPIEPMYAVTYAVVSAAAAWQGARLKEADVWNAAPYRPAWQIITVALAPVVSLGWLMFITPVAMAFIQTPAWPTFGSLPPLILGMLLAAAHALIGFTVGQRVKPLIAAPVLLCLVFVAVAFSHATTTTWLRYMAGEYSGSLGFGETATISSMLAEFLPTASIAAAAALFWVSARTITRIAAGVTVVAACTMSSYLIVKDWNHNPPLNVSVEKICKGSRPTVCMPRQASDDIADVKEKADSTYEMLMSFGVVDVLPEIVNDDMLYGRFTQRPTADIRYLPLSVAHRDGKVQAYIIKDSARPLCEIPTVEESRKIRFWLDRKMKYTPAFTSVASGDPTYTQAKHRAIMSEVDQVSKLTVAEQKAWFLETAKKACEGRP